MTRPDLRPPPNDHGPSEVADPNGPDGRAQVADQIAGTALELANCARAAGLTALAHLLEAAALEGAAEAEARRWPADAAG